MDRGAVEPHIFYRMCLRSFSSKRTAHISYYSNRITDLSLQFVVPEIVWCCTGRKFACTLILLIFSHQWNIYIYTCMKRVKFTLQTAADAVQKRITKTVYSEFGHLLLLLLQVQYRYMPVSLLLYIPRWWSR